MKHLLLQDTISECEFNLVRDMTALVLFTLLRNTPLDSMPFTYSMRRHGFLRLYESYVVIKVFTYNIESRYLHYILIIAVLFSV